MKNKFDNALIGFFAIIFSIVLLYTGIDIYKNGLSRDAIVFGIVSILIIVMFLSHIFGDEDLHSSTLKLKRRK